MSAAAGLFARHGYRGAPLAAVATAVDMTQPGLLHHFPSKADLLLAVLAERDEAAIRDMHDRWSAGGREFLTALSALVAHNATTPELIRLFTVLVGESVTADHPAHAFFVDRYARLRDRTELALRQGQDSGEFRADADVSAVASLIMAVMDGLQIQWLLDPGMDMVTGFATMIQMIDGHLAPPAG